MLYHKTFELGPDRDWVVFVHGAGGSSSIWFKQQRAYREHFNELLLDLRGHGQSNQLQRHFHPARAGGCRDTGRNAQIRDHLGHIWHDPQLRLKGCKQPFSLLLSSTQVDDRIAHAQQLH